MADAHLSPDDWVTAGVAALLEEGPDAVAVQPLARRLGTTKGSLYWHFASRDDLLRATLERWYQVATEDVITEMEASSEGPAQKARGLFARVTASSARYPGQLRLYAAADHPDIRRVLNRATRRRVEYVASLLHAAGVTPAVARRRAVLAYSAYLGHAQLTQSTPDVLPQTSATRRALVAEMARALLV
jgi:AcrR family transcriptional regulator